MASTIRIVVGTYEGLLYGWEMPTGTDKKAMKLTFGYAAHSECIKSVSLMTAKQGKTLISGGNDETIKYVAGVVEQQPEVVEAYKFGEEEEEEVICDDAGDHNSDESLFDEMIGVLQDILMDPKFVDLQTDFCLKNCGTPMEDIAPWG